MRVQNIGQRLISDILPGQIFEVPEGKEDVWRKHSMMKAGELVELKDDAPPIPMPKPQPIALDKMSGEMIAKLVSKITSIEELGKLAQDNRQPEVLAAIDARIREIKGEAKAK